MLTPIPVTRRLMTPARNLYCACCGALTRGRQWHNMDTGHGLCVACVPYIQAVADRLGEPTEIVRHHGQRGIHWGVAS